MTTARYGSSAPVSRMLESLLLRAGPYNFVTGEPIVGLMLVEQAARDRSGRVRAPERIERHHVFPRRVLTSWAVESGRQNVFANIALLSGTTNGWISDRRPREYVKELDDKLGQSYVDRIMRSHVLDAALLRRDQFDEQVLRRSTWLSGAAERLLDPRALHVEDLPGVPVSEIPEAPTLAAQPSGAPMWPEGPFGPT